MTPRPPVPSRALLAPRNASPKFETLIRLQPRVVSGGAYMTSRCSRRFEFGWLLYPKKLPKPLARDGLPGMRLGGQYVSTM
eukprot:CAMPEP_0198694028 /NCGR_PEP_ID=MMETSP1468-20131203/261825_1 /TAXON_ID=1461545 /ORGANISM="Mantoniella sp, Strain CCMP1436" /LENGTH=80 /DNA_ID=CAMNT_0044448993 /DNA_START=305 /DNA_END=547 /DNA_ORIENTATION=+